MLMTSSSTQGLVSQLASALLKKQWHLSTAESCTGGLVAAAITELAGSSDWFERGYVTYSNSAKSEDTHVSPELIAQHGAVSDQVARAMAVGAKQSSHAEVTLSITGIAGPTGGSAQKPVGTVCFAWILANDAIYSETKLFNGNRQEVRQQACEFSLKRLLELLLIK